MKEVTHQEIYDRLITLEAKVDKLNNETQEVVRAFSAAQGAFTVLEWIATAAKPVLWIAGVVTAFSFMISEYRKGTKTERNLSQSEVDEIRNLLFIPLDQTEVDYNARAFKNYKEYTVSTGSTLISVDEALVFNNFHEGIHLGYILALIKSL